MRLRTDARPWSVNAYAAILGAAVSWNLGVDLQRAFAEPGEAAPIALVSRASAAFLIPLIPAAAIWLYGSRVARALVTIASAGFAIWKVAWALRLGLPSTESGVRFAIGLAMNALVLLLYTPSARRWFTAKEAGDAPLSG